MHDPFTPRPLELVSLVLPAYNEEQVLPLLVARLDALVAQIPCAAEIIFVNDGSRDRTAALLAEAASQRPYLRVIEFSRNFGHQIAITAGTDFARGDVVIVMDSDLQDPPELVPAMLDKYRQGFDVVYAQRNARLGETWFKRATAAAFYRVIKRLVHLDLPENTGDFRLMSHRVVEALARLREQHRFVRGMVSWVGFRQTAIVFDRPGRAAGTTKYPLVKMLAFAWRAISSFSGVPLRMAASAGGMLMAAAVAGALAAGYRAAILGAAVGGWEALAYLNVGLFGFTLLVLGIIGDSLARVYEELKGRPLYVVQALYNMPTTEARAAPQRAAICVEAPREAEAPGVPPPKGRFSATKAGESRVG